jgi:hypothetical protein
VPALSNKGSFDCVRLPPHFAQDDNKAGVGHRGGLPLTFAHWSVRHTGPSTAFGYRLTSLRMTGYVRENWIQGFGQVACAVAISSFLYLRVKRMRIIQ